MSSYHDSEKRCSGQCPHKQGSKGQSVSRGLHASLFMVWTVSVDEWLEGNCLVHECGSFRVMFLKTVNVREFVVKGKKLTFNCESFEQVKKLSSSDYESFFRVVEGDGTVEIIVPEGFTIGIPKKVIDYGLR